MSKKQLNVEAITNELRGASLFFNSPTPPTEKSPVEKPANRPVGQVAERPQGRTVKRPAGQKASRPNGRSSKRIVKRHGFDIYHDQIVSLNKIQFEMYLRYGKKPSIGELVRPALDDIIRTKLKDLEES
jgi:hypothetical protein